MPCSWLFVSLPAPHAANLSPCQVVTFGFLKAARQVSATNQVAVAKAGAIPPLLTLMTSGTPAAKESAAAALQNIAENAADQGRVLGQIFWSL